MLEAAPAAPKPLTRILLLLPIKADPLELSGYNFNREIVSSKGRKICRLNSPPSLILKNAVVRLPLGG